ncbi:hypothetical protein ACFU7Y_27990 [Kitasatospora sp. NPDC057542]|uniref:hypothetical protein n=1 Tax=Streptomycetaceae TaxID=2062 RepID=UPI001CCF2537|nr:hypothetical protein [Streptomyces sp. LS1784]
MSEPRVAQAAAHPALHHDNNAVQRQDEGVQHPLVLALLPEVVPGSPAWLSPRCSRLSRPDAVAPSAVQRYELHCAARCTVQGPGAAPRRPTSPPNCCIRSRAQKPW